MSRAPALAAGAPIGLRRPSDRRANGNGGAFRPIVPICPSPGGTEREVALDSSSGGPETPMP
jgi:hypothetical protein